jgi:hypothetical protein
VPRPHVRAVPRRSLVGTAPGTGISGPETKVRNCRISANGDRDLFERKRKSPPVAGPFSTVSAKCQNSGLGGGDSRYRTGCPPPSHRTSLEPESGTGVSNAATERQNRPIWPMFAGRDHASQRLWRACCSQARLGLVRVVVENHSSGYPAVRICRRQCSPSDTSRSLFPQKTVPSRNSSLIVKTPSA